MSATGPCPSPIRQLLLFLGLLFASIVGGALLSDYFAPGSHLARLLGLLSLVVPLLVGMLLWLGVTILVAVWRILRRGLRTSSSASPRPCEIPPGSSIFLPTSVLIVGMTGLLVGALGSTRPFLVTFAAYVLVGLAHGLTCWALARHGYLPFPHD